MTRVVVTQADIDKGLRATCTLCPVALAVSRATGRAATVSPDRIHLKSGEFFYLPLGVKRAIARFDEQGLMEPFEFRIPCVPAK